MNSHTTAVHWPSGSLLARIPAEAREEILAVGTPLAFPAGSRLLSQGEASDFVLVIVKGIVKVAADTLDGHSGLLAVRVAGDVVGELAGIDQRPRLAGVTAAGAVQARRIARGDFLVTLTKHPDASLAVMQSVNDKLRFATRRRIDYGSYPVTVRLARLLVELAGRHGVPRPEGVDVGVELSHTEVAALIGAAEPSVQRAFRDLRRRGLLRTGYRHVLILRPDELREFARFTTADDVAE